MGVTAVAKKDFRDSIRSYTLLGLVLSFTAFAAGLAVIQWVPPLYRDSTVETSTLALLNSMRQPTVFFVPLISLAVTYNTIAGERESGSMRLLLALPNSRRDVVFGKYLGRTSVLVVGLLVGYAVAGLVALLTYESFDIAVFGLYTALTLFYGAVYTALATGFSAGMDSRFKALAGASALYSLFLLGWDVLLLVLQLLVYGQDIPEGGLPDWFNFIGLLNPSTAFMHAARAVIPEYAQITFYPESSAFYLQDWVGFVVLVVWAVVPLTLGYLRFARADIQ
ncbi:ABC transporter permease subunit [Haloarcula sediminis]|uniref:ABC transporter permease subunit n=1 Tax=Haloarcula sediminis TaxID=3111777 RepID=UPI002D76563D|nr:ABC transporter permease subunit [Haloarcula sp. CK38]